MFIVLAVVIVIAGIALGWSAFVALARARLLAFVASLLGAAVLLVIGAVLSVVALGTQGLQPLAGDTTAARLKVSPTGVQRYNVVVTFADGRAETYDVVGDDIALDGYVFEWQPVVASLGLVSSYRLDRISGSYRRAEQDVTAPHSVYPTGARAPIDLVAFARRVPLRSVFDARYGTVTYDPDIGSEVELRVSPAGFELRPPASSENTTPGPGPRR